jgi:acyl-CoA synthetase (AMP-forming)/AMP-acid ligase II
VLTSGTTGTPKGARRPTPAGFGPLVSIIDRIPLRAGDRVLIAAPLFHTWGYAALQVCFALRATVVLQRRFEPKATAEALAEHGCQAMFAVPVMVQRMLEAGPPSRRPPLRAVAVSGSALPGGLAPRFMDAYGDVLYNLYGSTEASWASIATPAELRRAPNTAGRPPRGTRVAILDPDGRTLPAGQVGRIFVGNDMLFEGYTSGAGREVHDGLLSTGDLGHLDADGLLFVDGREDDMIVSGGENVFPSEVEDLLARLPQVWEVAVVGVPDAEYGQRLAAFVALHPGERLDADGVREHVRQRLARFSVPRDVHVVDALPRNATGKVVTRDLLRDAGY